MPIIKVEGVGNVQFPDDLSQDELLQAVTQVGDPVFREQRKTEIRSELSPESMAKFQAEQEAQWNRDNPSSIPEGPRRFAAGALRIIEAPLRLGAEYKALSPVMWIPGVADASKSAADSLRGASDVLSASDADGINRTTQSWSDVVDARDKAGYVAGAAALGELGVGAILDNLPQLVPGAMATKWLQGAGLSLKAATRLAPLISTAPLETADALKEYQDAGADPLRAKLIAPVVGAVNAALETVGDSALLERAFMPEAKGAAKFILGQFLKEATTETAQEATTMAGRIPAGADPVSRQEAIDRLLTAGIAGGFAGAGTSGAIEAGRNLAQRAAQEGNAEQQTPVAPPDPVAHAVAVSQQQAPPPATPFEAVLQGNIAINDSIKRLQASKIRTDQGLTDYVAPASVSGPVDNYVAWANGFPPSDTDRYIRNPNIRPAQAIPSAATDAGIYTDEFADVMSGPVDQFIRSMQPKIDSRNAQLKADADRRQSRSAVESGMYQAPTSKLPEERQSVGQYPSPGPDENAVISKPQQPAPQVQQFQLPEQHEQLVNAVTTVANQFNSGKDVDVSTLLGAVEAGKVARRVLEGNISRLEQAGDSASAEKLYSRLAPIDSMLAKYGERFQQKGVQSAQEQRQKGQEQEGLLRPTHNLSAPNDINTSTPEELVPEGSLRLAEVLPSIDQSDNEVHRAVSAKLRELRIDMPIRVVSQDKFVSEFGDDRPGAYRYDTGELVLQQRGAGSPSVVVHEAAHGAISRALDDDAFRGDILKLRGDAITAIGDKFYGTRDHGSDWSNAQEFVADVSGSPELQAALRSVKVGDGKTSLWQRFLEVVRKLLGLKPSQTNMLDKVLSVALPAFSQPSTAARPTSFAPERYKNRGQVMNDLARPGMSREGGQAIVQRASAQAAMVPEAVVGDITKLATPDPTLTSYDNRIRKRTGQIVSWLVDQFNVWSTRNSVTTLPESTDEERDAKMAVAGGMILLDSHLREQADRLDRGTIERVLPAMERARASIEKARTLGLRASLIKSMRERMADEFGEYLDSSAQVGDSLATAEVDALRRATDKLANVRRKIGIEPAEIDKALSHIAFQIPQAVLANLKTPSDVLNYVVQNNVFGNAQDIPADTVDFLTYKVGTQKRAPLESFKGLIPALKRIQKITDEKQAAELTVERFEKRWADIHNRVKKAQPNVQPVAFRDFLVQYRRLLNEEQEAAEISRDLSRKFESLDIEIRAREAAKQVYASTISDPGYQAELGAAIDVLGAIDPVIAPIKAMLRGGQDNTEQPVLRYMVGGEAFDITWSLNPGAEDKNLETVTQMVRAIDEQLANPNLYVTARKSYEKLKDFANTWLNTVGNSEQFGGLRMNSFDGVNMLRSRLSVLFPFMTRDFVVRLMPGRLRTDALGLASATNALRKALDQVTLHPTFGRMRLNLKVDEAVKSHPGLTAKQWESEVFNYVIDSGQETTGAQFEVGDIIPETGHKVTKADLDAARINSKFASAAYKAVEGASGMSGVLAANPQLIEPEKSGLLRKGIKSGPLTAPRGRNRGVANDVNHESADSILKTWRDSKENGGTTKLSEQDWFFNRVVLSHVVTGNPEYDRKSQHEQAYRKLSHEYRKGLRDVPDSLDALVEDIVQLTDIPDTETVESMRKRVRNDLISEVDRSLQRFDDDLNGRDADARKRMKEDLAGLGIEGATRKEEQVKLLNKETIVSVLDSQSSFTTERGRMIAPPAFYSYSLASDASKGALLKAAIMPFHRRELQLLKAAAQAITTEKKRLQDAVEAGLTTNSKIRADVQSGKLYADISQLDLMKSMIEGVGDLYKDSVLSSAAHANRDPNLLESWLGADRMLLLAQPTALTSNLINAVSAGKVVPYWMLGMKGWAASNSASLLATNAYTIAVRATAGTKAGKWLMANRKKLMPGLRHIAQHMERATVAAFIAKSSAIAPERMRYKERVDAIKQLGTLSSESPVLWFGQDQTKTRQISRFLAKVPGMPEASALVNDLTRMADQFGNISSIDNSMEALRTLFLSTFRAMESRAKSGVPGWNDWSNPANALKPDEIQAIGFGEESMAMVRQILAPAGGFERAAYDFWLRTKDMSSSDRAVASPIANPGALNDVLDQLLGFINLPLVSNRPDVLRGETWLGRVLKSMTTFPGWISEWLGTLGLMLATSSKKPLLNRVAYSAVAIAVVGLLMAFVGMSAIEPRRIVYETIQGRTFPTLTPRSFLDDMTPSTAMKVLGASIASSIPYIGEVAADIMGAPTYRSSATDLTSMSRTLSMATDLKSAFEYGWKTGDTIGMLGQVARTAAPIWSVLWNRIPQFAERNAVADATRAARVAAGPLEVVQTGGRGGGGGEPSRFSTLIRRAVAAQIGGDQEEAQAMIAEARAEKAREGSADPDTAIKAALASQMPDRKAFGRTLEASEEAALIGRMSGRQKFAYMSGKTAVANLLSVMPTKAKKPKKMAGIKGLRLGGMKLKTPKLKMSMTGSSGRRQQSSMRWPSLGQGLSLRL